MHIGFGFSEVSLLKPVRVCVLKQKNSENRADGCLSTKVDCRWQTFNDIRLLLHVP
jgi:hypothetical protein